MLYLYRRREITKSVVTKAIVAMSVYVYMRMQKEKKKESNEKEREHFYRTPIGKRSSNELDSLD